MQLDEGAVFAGYTILRLLGAGGMGEVYLVQHPRLPRREALKVLPAELTSDREYRERFDREAAMGATLWHPNIVALHDRGEFDGQLWISMDYVEGTDAARRLQGCVNGLAPDEVVRIVTGVADALDYAHDHQMLHRDVKPANILIAQTNTGSRALLADFGIARRMDDPGTLTSTNMTVGTVLYAAPEQLLGDPLDGRADQYALAATAFHLLTGSPLFQHSNPNVVISSHLTKPPPSIEDRLPELSVLGPVFAKALAKSPDDRFDSCLDFAHALERELDALAKEVGAGERTMSSLAAAKRAKTRTRKVRWPFVVAAILSALIIAATAVVINGILHDRRPTPAAASGPVPSIAATVPADIRATGHLVIGVALPYTPNEFKNSNGQIVGFDVDLMNAVAKTLSLVPDYRELPFESIIPALTEHQLNLGASSVSDTKARESLVDFVTYFNKGTLWAQRPGPPIDPNAACGRRVSTLAGSVHDTFEIPAKSEVCVAAGLPPIDKMLFDREDDVTAALVAGKVDAMSADSPTTGFAIKLSSGALVAAGEVFDIEPYGWPVPKGSGLAESLRQALVHMIETGEYRTIATQWGLEKGMIDTPKIDGAIR
ncbi:MAG: bifunctional serine/threonine-protein kinase/transporter substrate-binding domain-containing protein [Mycobacterium sp.]